MGGSRGTRAGKKVKERRQGRKDFLRTTFTKQVQAAKYDGSNDLSKAKGNRRMLVETVTEGYSLVQPEEGTHAIQSTSEKSLDSSEYSGRKNGAYQSSYIAKSTAKNIQNSTSMKVLSEMNGQPRRGTRAGKQCKARQKTKKLSMLLTALSEECWKV